MSRTVSEPTDDRLVIYQAALSLLTEALRDQRSVRLIGVSTGSLQDGIVQRGLFEDPKKRCLTDVVDSLNEKLGKLAIRPASLIGPEKSDHITFKG